MPIYIAPHTHQLFLFCLSLPIIFRHLGKYNQTHVWAQLTSWLSRYRRLECIWRNCNFPEGRFVLQSMALWFLLLGSNNCYLLCLEFASSICMIGPFSSLRWLLLSCHLLSEGSLPSQVTYVSLAPIPCFVFHHSTYPLWLTKYFLFCLFYLPMLKYKLHMSMG